MTAPGRKEAPRLCTAYIGFGSNMGDPLANCRLALEHVRRIAGVKLLRCSSFYRTEPVGFRNQEWFVNGAAEITTTLSARELLAALLEVEKNFGRQRETRWAPRTIDLDILFFGQEIIREEGLTIPHPELQQRRFVLTPLMELAPYLIHPVYCVSVTGLMGRLEDESKVELVEPYEANGQWFADQ